MTAPAQQPTWPPPVGAQVTATGTCCGQTLAEVRFTSTGDPEQHIVVPGCPNSVRLSHKPRLTFTWVEDGVKWQTAPVQPEQPLRQRIAEALDATFTSAEDFDAETAADAVMAVVQAELAAKSERNGILVAKVRMLQDELAARDAEIQQLREQLDAVPALHRPVQRGAMTICDACSPKRGDGPSRYVLVIYPCPTARALNAKPRPTT